MEFLIIMAAAISNIITCLWQIFVGSSSLHQLLQAQQKGAIINRKVGNIFKSNPVSIIQLALTLILVIELGYIALQLADNHVPPQTVIAPVSSSPLNGGCSTQNFNITNMTNGGVFELKDAGGKPYSSHCNKISITFDFVERTVYVYVKFPNTNGSTQQIAIDSNDIKKPIDLALNVKPSTPYYIVLVGTAGKFLDPPHYTIRGTFEG